MQLLYPKTHHQLHGVYSIMKESNVKMVLKNHNIVIPIKIQEANLTIIYNYYVNSAQKKRHGPLLRLFVESISFDSLDFFGDIRTDTDCSGTEV